MNVLNKQSKKSELVIDLESERARRMREKARGGTRDHGVKSETTSAGEKSG